jgi:hypothetical protein
MEMLSSSSFLSANVRALSSALNQPSPGPIVGDEAADDDDGDFFTDDQNKTLMCITIIESSLSFIGSLIIILSFLSFKRLRKFSLRLVFWLSVSDLGNCISYFLGDPKDGFLCTTQAMIMR